VSAERKYPMPERVRFTLCVQDPSPVPRHSACWSSCGAECWVEATGPFEPVEGSPLPPEDA
jgi:hypothetical protein